MEKGDLCLTTVKGKLKLAAVMEVKGSKAKVVYEEEMRLLKAWRSMNGLNKVIYGKGEGLERLKTAIHNAMMELM